MSKAQLLFGLFMEAIVEEIRSASKATPSPKTEARTSAPRTRTRAKARKPSRKRAAPSDVKVQGAKRERGRPRKAIADRAIASAPVALNGAAAAHV